MIDSVKKEKCQLPVFISLIYIFEKKMVAFGRVIICYSLFIFCMTNFLMVSETYPSTRRPEIDGFWFLQVFALLTLDGVYDLHIMKAQGKLIEGCNGLQNLHSKTS